jgi:hypothetical protein
MADKFPQHDWDEGDVLGLLFEDSFAADLMEDEFFADPPPAGGGLVKVWSGSAWIEKPVKVWTGAAWATKPLKSWDGSAWV